MRTKRHRTKQRGVYYVDHDDGSRSYIATWKEQRPINVVDPSPSRRRTVEKQAATFEGACLLQAEGEAAEMGRHGTPPQSWVDRLAERMMALKFFEYRGRQ